MAKVTLIRVRYGKKSTPKNKREYQINGKGPVGTIKEFKEAYPNTPFVIIDPTVDPKSTKFKVIR